jgi:hypothetical protein
LLFSSSAKRVPDLFDNQTSKAMSYEYDRAAFILKLLI